MKKGIIVLVVIVLLVLWIGGTFVAIVTRWYANAKP